MPDNILAQWQFGRFMFLVHYEGLLVGAVSQPSCHGMPQRPAKRNHPHSLQDQPKTQSQSQHCRNWTQIHCHQSTTSFRASHKPCSKVLNLLNLLSGWHIWRGCRVEEVFNLKSLRSVEMICLWCRENNWQQRDITFIWHFPAAPFEDKGFGQMMKLRQKHCQAIIESVTKVISLVVNFATGWHHLYLFQNWPPGARWCHLHCRVAQYCPIGLISWVGINQSYISQVFTRSVIEWVTQARTHGWTLLAFSGMYIVYL